MGQCMIFSLRPCALMSKNILDVGERALTSFAIMLAVGFILNAQFTNEEANNLVGVACCSHL